MTSDRIKYVYLGCYFGLIGIAVAAGALSVVAEGIDRGSGELVQTLAALVLMPFLIGLLVCAMWWVHDAWSSVPEGYREVPLLGRVSPALAVGLFFVPCFNAIWIFLCHLGLASSMNAALESQGSTQRASTGLAVAACCLGVLPYCNLLVGPLLWFGWMENADRARRELARVDAQSVARVF